MGGGGGGGGVGNKEQIYIEKNKTRMNAENNSRFMLCDIICFCKIEVQKVQ